MCHHTLLLRSCLHSAEGEGEASQASQGGGGGGGGGASGAAVGAVGAAGECLTYADEC
jgi:hypothetical protein